eukprot:Opistho-2@26750
MADNGASDDNIKVFVRVRPGDVGVNQADSEGEQRKCVSVDIGNRAVILTGATEPKVFTYDHVATETATQEEVFAAVGKVISEGCIMGYNGTIFAYGQTGSGKTFTMLGPQDDHNIPRELRGVIPRTFEHVFSLISREVQMKGNKKEYLCKCSFLEIYNEQIFDLLDPTSNCLHLREDIKRGVFVEGQMERNVTSAAEAYEVLMAGSRNRRVASTSMNRESSRSHAVFTMEIQSKEMHVGDVANILCARLNLIDLAGSERQSDTNALGMRLKEAGSINKSLSALGNVINALTDVAHGKSRHVHYRDSKLTFLLRDSLGGNAKTFIIANISPLARCYGETLSTLKFARGAKLIKNKAVINEALHGNVVQLQDEVRKLKDELQQTTFMLNTLKANPRAHVDNGGSVGGLHIAVEAMVEERDKMVSECERLTERSSSLEEMVRRQENAVQSTKMIVKFRESYIAKLEKSAKGGVTPSDVATEKFCMLAKEIDELKAQYDHHPDVTRFAEENAALRFEVKRLRAQIPLNSNDNENAEMRSLRDKVVALSAALAEAAKAADAAKSFVPPSPRRPKDGEWRGQTEADAHVKKMQTELRETKMHMQTELQTLREREETLEGDLLAANAVIAELESSLKAYKMKSNFERETIFDEVMLSDVTMEGPGDVLRELTAVREENASLRTKVDEFEVIHRTLKQQIAKAENSRRVSDIFSMRDPGEYNALQKKIDHLASELSMAARRNEELLDDVRT